MHLSKRGNTLVKSFDNVLCCKITKDYTNLRTKYIEWEASDTDFFIMIQK